MRCGLHGKLPAKRDFVAVSAPKRFIRIWEPWVEQGMTESRAHGCEAEWKRAFSSAPVWRFWLGPALCGETITGAFMPSRDSLGRLFPLTLIGVAEKGEALTPPDVDCRDPWFKEVEGFLRATRDGQAPFETTLEALGALASLAQAEASRQGDTRAAFRTTDVGGGFFSLARNFTALRRKRNNSLPAKATYWWTLGGGGREPLAWTQDSMPDPAVFNDMMTRGFENRPEAPAQSE